MAPKSSNSACPDESASHGGSVADAFTTILYGVAVSQVALDGAKANSAFPVAAALAVVLYFFVDWLSRVYLPSRLPCDDQKRVERIGTRIIKSVLEIAIVYALLCVSYSAFHKKEKDDVSLAPLAQTHIVQSNEKDGVSLDVLAQTRVVQSFEFFLVLTFSWNLLMIHVMKGLSWRNLAVLSIQGNAAEDPKFQKYGENLRTNLELLAEAVKDSPREIGVAKGSIEASILGCRALIVSVGQLIVNHLVWSPLAALVALLLSTTLYSGGRILPVGSVLANLPSPWCWLCLGAGGIILGLLLIMCIIAFVSIRRDLELKSAHSVVAPELKSAHAVVAMVPIFSLVTVGAVTVAVAFQPNLKTLWLIVLATLLLPAIRPYVISHRVDGTKKDGIKSKYQWIGGVVSILALLLAYLSLSAGELVLFLLLESIIVCLFLCFCTPGDSSFGSKNEEATE